jgi:hypothetical protein
LQIKRKNNFSLKLLSVMSNRIMVQSLIPSFHKVALFAFSENMIDPFSLVLIMNCVGQYFPYLVVAAITKLRYADVLKLQYKIICQRQSYLVRQEKTGYDIMVDLKMFAGRVNFEERFAAVDLYDFSYAQLARTIIRARQKSRIKLPPGVCDETHIFRHLWASWYVAQFGLSPYVSKILGHSSLESISSYLHPTGEFSE